MDNFSMRTADRVAHFKIVIISLVLATVAAAIAITSHLPPVSPRVVLATMMNPIIMASH
jgi:hypothetical protein